MLVEICKNELRVFGEVAGKELVCNSILMQISILHAYILRYLKISAIGNKSGLGKPPPSDTLKSEGLFGSVHGV